MEDFFKTMPSTALINDFSVLEWDMFVLILSFFLNPEYKNERFTPHWGKKTG